MNIGRKWIFILSIFIALSCLESTQGSRLKKVRRSIENPDEEGSATAAQSKGSPRRRLTLADDVFTTTSREFEVTGYHRAVGAAILKVFRKFARSVGSVLNFTKNQWRRAMNSGLNSVIGSLQSLQTKNKAVIQEAEASPAPTISTIYDSISSVVEPTPSKQQQPAKISTPTNNEQKAATKSAPLRSTNNSPKAASTRGARTTKKSVVQDLATGGSSFEAMNSAAVSASEEENGVVPSTSMIAGLLPTLIAGIVFTTAGSMVGYLWNGEWADSASSVYGFFWGDEQPSSDQSTAYSRTAEEEYGGEYSFNSNSFPITPDR